MMVSVSVFNRRFTPNWQMMLLAAAATAFLAFLGVWQLQRGEEKKQMLANYVRLKSQAPLNWTSEMAEPGQYQQIKVEGKYLPVNILLDNQAHQHQFGYQVLTPLIVGKKLILVDRGWIPGNNGRRQLPVISTPSSGRVSGYVYFPSAKTMVLGAVLEKKTADMMVVERIDTKLISQVLHKTVYPFIMRLNKEEAGGFVREWPVVSMSPQRHYAYAVQWFAMAFTIVILFIGLNLKKVVRKDEA